jgi:hypothetical protein
MQKLVHQSRDYFAVFARDPRRRGWLYLTNLLVLKAFNMFIMFGFKSVLWLEPPHPINLYRMVAYVMLLDASLSQSWRNVVEGRGGWRNNGWALFFWAVQAVDFAFCCRLGYHVPIWDNTPQAGRVLFALALPVAGASFAAFFK